MDNGASHISVGDGTHRRPFPDVLNGLQSYVGEANPSDAQVPGCAEL